MRRHHFELLQPVCPVCQQAGLGAHPLDLDHVEHESDRTIWEGRLKCSYTNCNSEFPIIDGIPILLPNLRTYIAEQIFQIMSRKDLSSSTISLLGDCCSQNSHLDVSRQHLSCYAWDHYGEFDTSHSPLGSQADAPTSTSSAETIQPGSIVRAMRVGLAADHFRRLPDGPVLDAGCGVGRTAFEIAEHTSREVLGIDLNFSMLQLAALLLRTGKVKYAKRRCGLVYDEREFEVTFPRAQQVDFWVCDAQALPLAPHSFAAVVAMNLLDSVASPAQLVSSLHTALKPDGQMLLASPYDWSTAVTPVEAWLGGHSQRSPVRGSPQTVLPYVLEQSGFEIIQQWPDIPWNVRMHDRSSMAYRLHMVHCRGVHCRGVHNV